MPDKKKKRRALFSLTGVFLAASLLLEGCGSVFLHGYFSADSSEAAAETYSTVSIAPHADSSHGESQEVESREVKEGNAADSYPEPETEAKGLSGFAYEQLSFGLQSLYARLYSGIQAEKKTFSVYADSTDDVGSVLNAVLTDHPEFFWITGSASIRGVKGNPLKEVTLTFDLDADQIDSVKAEIEAAAEAFISQIPEGAGEYDIVKAAYEYIIKNTDYELNCEQDQNIQSVFLHHKSVCAGYARAFQYLLQKAGVYCAYIEGTISPNGDSHAWNLVRIDGAYTLVDPTWGDPTYGEDSAETSHTDIIYDYLCVTSEELGRTHVPSGKYTIPDCTSTDYDYYRLNGMFYKSADADALSRALWNAVDNNITTTFLKFADKESYQKAYDLIFHQGLIDKPLQQRMTWDEKSSLQYYYSGSDSMYIIKIFW